jgi:hypothetical protein
LAEHAVDVTDHLHRGVASLQAHVEYLRGLGAAAMADPGEFLESFGRQAGSRLGTRYAVSFELIQI